MSIATDLRAFLLADPILAGLIGGRLYPLRLPQRPAVPALTYQWISGHRVHSTDGASGLAGPRVQFDAWAATYLEVEAVMRAVRLRLDGYRGPAGDDSTIQGAFFASERDFDEDAAELGTGAGEALYRRSADFFIWHEEETAA